MNVFILSVVVDIWAVVVDDMHDIAYIQPTSRHTGRNHDGRLAILEGTPRKC